METAFWIFPVFLKDDTRASPAILLAPYGDNGSNCSFSDIGNVFGSPYTVEEDAKTKFFTFTFEQASKTLNVPLMFTSIVSPGFVIDS